jgi:diadenylate cyclase
VVRLFAASVFFCVVVIFQPEFRDALEKLGNSSVLNPGKNHVSHKQFDMAKEIVEATVTAVEKMAENKTGALIVFEGLTKLGDYVETGRLMDARVTSHLLQNIFFDKAPLHDGALIIRNMRMYCASCVLPSTVSKQDFGTMGMRHRAAVGVTEVSDALVIVVSEQTGIVSVAQGGKLLRGVDRETLQDVLMTYLAGKLYLRARKNENKKRFFEQFETPAQGEPSVEAVPDTTEEETAEFLHEDALEESVTPEVADATDAEK